jgi:hypothetical protein
LSKIRKTPLILPGHWLQTTVILKKWAIAAVTCALFARVVPTRRGRCDDARNASTYVVMVTYMPGIQISEFKSQVERRVEMIASA